MIDKWFQIGVQLGVSESKLRQIESDYHTLDRRFSEMMSFWLNGNTQVPVTWMSLVQVLESRFVSEKGLANQLREKAGLKRDNKEGLSSTGIINFVQWYRQGRACGFICTQSMHLCTHPMHVLFYYLPIACFTTLPQPVM